MAWKLFLIPTEPLQGPPSQVLAIPPVDALREIRKEYTELLLNTLRAPDGSYEDGLTIPGIPELPRKTDKLPSNLQRNNPLSLDQDNPWKEWFETVELRKTIRQDVERTFPDVAYFRDPDVQSQLTLILFVHSMTQPDIGYRQGMHELLAPILYALDYDALSDEADAPSDLKEFCSHAWIAADAWALFRIFMQSVGVWYEWREPIPPSLPPHLKSQYRHGAPDGPVEIKPYVAPIVQACQRLQSDMLKPADPMLWRAMQNAGIEPQIYGIRWLRLLFTREFPLPDAMAIWDGVVAYESTFELVPWICVVMLMRIRNKLIPSDYTGQLTFLLRYPPPPTTVDPSCSHHANLLLRQAFALQTAPNPSTGASIVIENRNLLNIPLDVPEPPPPPQGRRTRPVDRRKSLSASEGRVNGAGMSSQHRKDGSTPSSQQPQMGLPELFARGLLERGESLGINRTVMNAVSELRKNLPDLSNNPLIRSPNASSSSLSSFPLVDERPPEERPPWEPKTRFEIEREISAMKTLHKQLADSVGVAVDALLQDESTDAGEERLKAIRDKKREAIECLAYVRDVLSGSSSDVDDERLFPEEEYDKRKKKAQVEKEAAEKAATLLRPDEPASAYPPPALPPKPAPSVPAAPTDRRPRPASRDSQHPLSSLSRTPVMSPAEPPQAQFARTAATLPRRGSSASATNPASPMSKQAPWNHTPSSFSTQVNITALPRPPPPSSKNLPSARGSSRRQDTHDPLGAIP
ncbi:RabGAP/TBC [Rickenella mellea]|uniref:RabGAP/TBC n=1 Tax=Rickenella mellea TaxID=50990 RepID=A0A4Y7QK56_9AGAM|nr:RabGAP/TBC [Rickenella mellea]